MNIELPPIEPCHVVWPKFVSWLEAKMIQDVVFFNNVPLEPICDIKFRGLSFDFCPFCGKVFDARLPIQNRHGEEEI